MTCTRGVWHKGTLSPCGAPGVEQRGTAVRCVAHRGGWPKKMEG